MATYKKINSEIQVKEINGKRWICKKVELKENIKKTEYDFIDIDGKLWKKIRLFTSNDLKNEKIAGKSQYLDDKI